MSLSTVESHLALYSSKTGVGISSYSFMICFLGKEYHRGLELSQRSFSLSHTAHLYDISNMLYMV